MIQHLPYLAAIPGILACGIGHNGTMIEARWSCSPGPIEAAQDKILGCALDLLSKTTEPTVRLVVGKHTHVAQREGDHAVMVSFATGDAVAKSIRRTIRRLAARAEALPIPETHRGVEFVDVTQPPKPIMPDDLAPFRQPEPPECFGGSDYP